MAFESLYGTYDSTLDEKGRVIIPAALREHYKGQLIVTQGTQNCVWIMLPEVFLEFKKRLKDSKKELSSAAYEYLQNLHVHPKQNAEIDKNSGRIPIVPPIRTYARLVNKKCLVMCAENRLEIWDSQCYYDYLEENRGLLQEVTSKVGSRLYDFDSEEGDA